MKVNTSITTIELWNNGIGAEGARYLAEALKVNPSITTIHLSGNRIGAEGARYLSEINEYILRNKRLIIAKWIELGARERSRPKFLKESVTTRIKDLLVTFALVTGEDMPFELPTELMLYIMSFIVV